MAKSENRIMDKIGILGGTFDPPHIGHLKISRIAKKKFNLNKIIWAITKKNPFKNKSFFNLNKRIKLSKILTKKYKYIKIGFFEKKINSNKTIHLIRHFKSKGEKREIYFLLGADNLLNFHKWNNWKKILKICKIVVFDRNGFKAKAKKSLAYKLFKNKGLIYVEFKKVNISSSKIRNF